MANDTKLVGQVTKEYLTKFPKAATRTIANMLVRDHPKLFKSFDTARDNVRYYRGTKGKFSRAHLTDKTFVRPVDTSPKDPFAWIPDPIAEKDPWGPVQFDGPMKCLILADMHVPFHDKEALKLAIQFGLDRGANAILLNGDTWDCHDQSFWEKDPRQRHYKEELRQAREVLAGLRATFPKAQIICKLGNHEERHERYMRLKCPEFLDIQEFDIPSLYNLDKLKIQLIRDKRPVRLGKLNVLHGHEYSFAIQNPVSPARGLFLRSASNTLCGHFHQSTYYSFRGLEGKIISCWSTGCLCQITPEYRRLNGWSHGFAFVDINKDGAFSVENLRIIDGKIWH